jgi:nitrogen fixation/metabolism regulation signal transduction histidine kinase
MAEFATGVLHNVSNVLNSVNVASSCVAESLKKSKAASLGKVAALMREHHADLGTYLTVDPKGKQLPGFLGQLAEHLVAEQQAALNELAQLQKNIEHIRTVVTMQQSCAKASAGVDTHQISDLVDDALRMNANGLSRHDIQVVKEFQEGLAVNVELTIRASNGGDRVRISVTDNGIGIAAENLDRIFSRGFTTKKDGHGFGLHSGAVAAREMGGALLVHSDGPGAGATFTLELPQQPTETPHE